MPSMVTSPVALGVIGPFPMTVSCILKFPPELANFGVSVVDGADGAVEKVLHLSAYECECV